MYVCEISLAKKEIEHLLANEQYVDSAKIEFIEVW